MGDYLDDLVEDTLRRQNRGLPPSWMDDREGVTKIPALASVALLALMLFLVFTGHFWAGMAALVVIVWIGA